MNSEIEYNSPEIGAVIITGSNCTPGIKPFDDSARQVVETLRTVGEMIYGN